MDRRKLILIIAALCGLVSFLIVFFFSIFSMRTHRSTTYQLTPSDTIPITPAPVFDADSAMAHVVAQCAFGPRTPNSQAHDQCADWIVARFEALGASVEQQRTTLKGYDGTDYACRNIMAHVNPDLTDRVVIGAHYDSRLWADHDPDPARHHSPVPAANDGASGVAVMLEMARCIASMPLNVGVDFVCFDLEDQGTPEWAKEDDEVEESPTGYWCLGSKYWAEQMVVQGYQARYGVVLDMVGGRDASFAIEGYSKQVAVTLVNMVWHLADQLGFSAFFPIKDGGFLMDDHIPMNSIAHIPTIDIVPNVPSGRSSFGETWHTVSDTPEHINPEAMRAVGQTLLQLLYNDNDK